MKPEASAAEVLTAVRAYIAGGQHGGVIELRYDVYADVARLAEVDTDLAGQGELRKAGADTAGPDGRRVPHNQARFYTPGAWEDAVTRGEQALTEAERWAAVRGRLIGAGFTVMSSIGHPVELSLDDWERLLDTPRG
jgi:hypothetical protein